MAKLGETFKQASNDLAEIKKLYEHSVKYANEKDSESYKYFVELVGEERGKDYADSLTTFHEEVNKIPWVQREKQRQAFVHNVVDDVKDAGKQAGTIAKAFGNVYKEGLKEDVQNLKTTANEVVHGYAPSMVFGMNGDKPYTMKEAYEGLASDIKAAHDKEALHAKREAETEIFGVNNSNTASVEGQATVE